MTIKYHYRLYMAIGNIISSISPSPTLRWGWFIACRCVCSAEAYVPALVSSACQSATGREIGDEDWGKVRVLSTNFGKNARNLIMVNHVWSCLVMFNNHVPFQNDHLEGMPFSDTQLILPIENWFEARCASGENEHIITMSDSMIERWVPVSPPFISRIQYRKVHVWCRLWGFVK